MNYIRINIYYKKRSVLLESFKIDESHVMTLDDARLIVVKHLDSLYSNIKYKINLFKNFSGDSEINIDFEDDLCLSREFKLREILK